MWHSTSKILRLITLLAAVLSAPAVSRAAFIISEILPVNTTGLKDEDGTFQPWIEIWNTDPTNKFSLTNYRLVHGATIWLLPDIEILPDERLVIFASGKNRQTSTSRLHTNFTLSATGGALSFQQPSGTVESSFPAYPALAANVSHGRDLADPTLVGNYTSPTPGDPNNYTGTGVAGKVVASLSSRAFTGTLNVNFTQVTPEAGVVVRYTTDGSVPTPSSTAYVSGKPVVIPATTLLRARVFQTGKLPGETESMGYLLLNGTTSGFHTAAPIVVVSNFGLGTFPNDGDQPSFMWVWEPSPTDGRARLSSLPTLTSRTVVDRRGSSTLGNPKTNFNLETRHGSDDADRNVSLLGMPAESDWVFHAPYYYDRSALHNPFFYQLSNNIGRLAMRTRMAEVFVETSGGELDFTGTDSGDYFGLYNVMEKVRRGKDRVDVADLDTYDNDAVGKTGGHIFKVDRRDPGDGGFSAGGQGGLVYYYPKEIALKTPQRDPQEQYLTDFLNSINTVINDPGYTNPTTGYAAWIDVPAAVDHHLLNIWTFNVDALVLSAYLHKDREGKLVYGPVWDVDRGLSSTDGRDANPAVWGWNFFTHWWWPRLFSDPDFYQRYIDRWVELRKGKFSPTSVNALLDALNAQATAEAVARDLARWNQAKREWTSPFTGAVYPASQDAEVQRLKDYLQQRANFFESQWVAPVTFSQNGGSVSPGFTLTMSAPGATIYYTLNGTDPRPSGGGAPTVGGGVFTYTGPTTINATTRVRARAYNPGWTALTGGSNPPLVSFWSGLADSVFSTAPAAVTGKLNLTEVHYNPLPNGATDGDEYEFLEFKNVTATSIDLTGLTFSNGIEYSFPPAATLAPGAFWIIARNAAKFAERYPFVTLHGLYTGKLDNSGERFALLSAGGAPIFDFSYDDVSPWPLTADGLGSSLVPIVPSVHVTPGDPATWRSSSGIGGSPGADDPALGIPGIIINEVLTNSTLPLIDSIELHNPTAAPVAITDWWLTDDSTVPKKYRIPATTIPAGGYVTFTEAQFNPTPGLGTSFSFSSNGEQACLFSGDASGNLTGYARFFTYQAADENVSFGRYVNSVGEESFPAQSARTPGAANAGPRIGPLVINEIQYFPAVGLDEYVEIRNVSASAVNLWDPANPTNTWKLTGLDFVFPANTTIPAGGYALIVGLSPSAFRTKYAIPASVQIFATAGILNNSGQRLTLEKPAPPYVNGAQTVVPFVIVDSVRYSSVAPWQSGAAGGGSSLQRSSGSSFADDPANWGTGGLTPGAPNVINQVPSIALTNPPPGASYIFPSVLEFSTTASDLDGVVTKVEFFSGSTLIGTDTTAPFSFAWTSFTTGSHTITARATDNSFGTTTSAPVTIQVTGNGTGGAGTGWYAQYYKDSNGTTHLVDPPLGTRTDATLNFNSTAGWPNNFVPGVAPTGTLFSGRWSGRLLAPATGTFNFYTGSADGIRLFINGQLLINHWTDHAYTTHAAALALTAGQFYDIVVEYYQNLGDAVLRLDYECTAGGIARQVIPAARVYPAGAPLLLARPGPVTLSTGQTIGFNVLATGGGALTYQWQRNNVNIAGATSTSLLLQDPLATQAGTYRVIVTNAMGSTTSGSAGLAIPDTDGDSIPDYWETQNGLNPAVANPGDTDGDGASDVAEYLAGTHPQNAASHLTLSVIQGTVPVTNYRLSFTGQSNRSYSLQYKNTLSAPTWSPLHQIPAANGLRALKYIDPAAGQAERYYRVITPLE